MRCYLIRHGDALPAFADPERPLSARGREEVALLGRLAAERGVEVAEICHSGIRRARETAERLAEYLKPARGVRAIGGLLPEDDPAIGKAELDLLSEPVMWVGHLPYMGRLAEILVGDGGERPAVAFWPATMLCLVKVDSGWAIEWCLVPELEQRRS